MKRLPFLEMASSTLYTFPENFRDFKILIAAQYSKANLKVNPDFVFGKTNKSSEFLKKFPHGKVPALQTSNNKFIFESNAIAYYVSNEQLSGGSCAVDQAQVVQWMSFADQEIIPHMANWVFPCLNIMQLNKQATDTAKESLKRSLGTLDAILLHQTFLVGERLTLADICVASALVLLYRHVFEPSFRASFVNVNRWFLTCINQPEFKTVLKDVNLCDKAAQFDAKKYAELQGSGAGSKSKVEKKVKEAKPQQKAPKKEEVPEPAEEMDETELILAKEDKSKDPFEVYPKGTFVMDNFKKSYSNEETTISIPFFWNNFDKENYSIWHCDYKYPEDLTLVFMSCNLISGMMQRLDKMRKNAFGSMLLFGEDNKSTISGIWVWRGHDLAFLLSPDWQVDFESYNWRKLDPDNEETKKLVQEYFSWEGDFGGKKFNQGKIFK